MTSVTSLLYLKCHVMSCHSNLYNHSYAFYPFIKVVPPFIGEVINVNLNRMSGIQKRSVNLQYNVSYYNELVKNVLQGYYNCKYIAH